MTCVFRQLIGKKIDCNHNDNQEEGISQSLRLLHNMGPSHIIISSISAAKTNGNQTMLQMRASTKLAG
jgi:pyridoxal/pyridoxine/pyridoxamine kinase